MKRYQVTIRREAAITIETYLVRVPDDFDMEVVETAEDWLEFPDTDIRSEEVEDGGKITLLEVEEWK